MEEQMGTKKLVMTAVAGLLGIGLILGAFGLVGFFGFQNDANRFENDIRAQYSVNQNVYDNGWKMVREKAKVPVIYEEQLEKLYKSALDARYGDQGAKGLLLFIKEQNPQLDPAVYTQVQQAVEIFRKSFEQSQTELVSRKQTYSNYLTATYSGRFYNMFSSYPHLDLTKYDIVTSEKTEQDFSTKKAQELELK
jgi:hypothetical protein